MQNFKILLRNHSSHIFPTTPNIKSADIQMWWTCREQVVIGSLKWHTPFSGRGPDTVYQNLKCFFWPRNFSCRSLFILRQGLCPMNGVLEYRVSVMQSKFLVQSHFKITHTLLVCVEQLGRDKLTELYIRSLFILSPHSLRLYFGAVSLKCCCCFSHVRLCVTP